MIENGRVYWALMKAASEAIREYSACRFLAGKPRVFERPAECAPWDDYPARESGSER